MNIHAAVMLLLFEDIWTDRQTSRHGETETRHIKAFRESIVQQRQMVTTVLFS